MEKSSLIKTVYTKQTLCVTLPDLILLQNVVRVLTTRNCIVYRLVWLNAIPEEGRRVSICLGGKINYLCVCMKCICGPGSSFGIATNYGLEGLG